MRSKTGVLVSIKIFQLIGSVSCMTLHTYAYTSGLNSPHITVFCGTYMGFTLVNMAFCVSAILGKPAAEELDMAFGVIGSILFYVCGVLGMYFVRREQVEEQHRTHAIVLPDAYELNPRFFEVSRAQAVVSLMTALSFVFDACLKFDMWKYEMDERNNRLPPDAFDPPDLRLFCFVPCEKWRRDWKERKEREAGKEPEDASYEQDKKSPSQSKQRASSRSVKVQDGSPEAMRDASQGDRAPAKTKSDSAVRPVQRGSSTSGEWHDAKQLRPASDTDIPDVVVVDSPATSRASQTSQPPRPPDGRRRLTYPAPREARSDASEQGWGAPPPSPGASETAPAPAHTEQAQAQWPASPPPAPQTSPEPLEAQPPPPSPSPAQLKAPSPPPLPKASPLRKQSRQRRSLPDSRGSNSSPSSISTSSTGTESSTSESDDSDRFRP